MLKSTHNYPVFQEKRDEMDIRPLQYLKKVGEARYHFETWKDRRFDERFAVREAQKREPLFSTSKDWTRRQWW